MKTGQVVYQWLIMREKSQVEKLSLYRYRQMLFPL